MPGSGGPWRAVACEWERSEEGSRGWDEVQSEEVHLKNMGKKKKDQHLLLVQPYRAFKTY